MKTMPTDKHKRLRKAHQAENDFGKGSLVMVNSSDLGALLAERDALREALETMVEMVEMNGFGRDYAMDVARAALGQKQGD